MSSEVVVELLKLLERFEPGSVLPILVPIVLAYRAPQILKELFAGVSTLMKARPTTKATKATRRH
jgi:hypothetical protein